MFLSISNVADPILPSRERGYTSYHVHEVGEVARESGRVFAES